MTASMWIRIQGIVEPPVVGRLERFHFFERPKTGTLLVIVIVLSNTVL